MPSTKAAAAGRSVARQPDRRRVTRPLGPAAGRRLGLGTRGQGLSNFFRELRGEIRKVVWPTRREVVNLTAVIVALSAALGALLGIVDFLFSEFFRFLLRSTGAAGY